MKLTKTWSDIREGDAVCVSLYSQPQEVLAIVLRGHRYLEVTLDGDDNNRWFSPSQPVLLVRRPRPDGKSAGDILEPVEAIARRLVEAFNDYRAINECRVGAMHDHVENPRDVLAELRDAMDAFELGEPPVVVS